jgi:hypothetical protein
MATRIFFFIYRAITFCGGPFQGSSIKKYFVNSLSFSREKEPIVLQHSPKQRLAPLNAAAPQRSANQCELKANLANNNYSHVFALFKFAQFAVQCGALAKHLRSLGYFPVRSPLLGESLLIYFPPPTEMFHFGGLASCLAAK